MECNKEEALKAKSIAEKKLESKDFKGARKFALKAQQLYPELENIAQMLVVCNVHCSAEQKLLGNVIDWYKILQIDLTADDATIRKQYRKFALQLHPDKNKFAGAEAAFKLIGEAQRVLLDRGKRSSFDMNLRRFPMNKTAMPSYHQQNVQMNFNPVMRTNVRPPFTNFNPQQQQQSRQPTQQGLNGGRPTFWTVCSFCNVRYEYYREVLNRSLRCQQCSRPFIAYEVDAQSTQPAANSSHRAFGHPNNISNHGAFKAGVGSQGNLHTHRSNAEPYQKKGSTSNVSEKRKGKRRRKRVVESSESSESIGSTDSEGDTCQKKGSTFNVSKKPNEKRRKRVVESSKSSESIGSTDSEDDILPNNDGTTGVATHREVHPRRSMRQRHQVSYKENVSDDDNGLAQAKVNHQNGLADDQKEAKHNNFEESSENANVKMKEVRGKETVGSSKVDDAPEHSTLDPTDIPDVFVYPDPEFSDFDKDKKEECFAVGQIWAIYDSIDGMPRFYAIIRSVLSPGFKLRITWFEPNPEDDDEIKWVDEELPSACGKFKLGKTETTEDHLMFSHLTFCEKINRFYKVYPRKGETWALFKNWDIKWHMDAESHRQYDFEFVEVLSDYVEGVGVIVAYLAKLKGFVSLFFRITKEGNSSFQIPPNELFRFSHRVPSFKMTGQERVGVPVGSYELDPVSLPKKMEEIAVPDDLEVKVGHNPSVGVAKRSSNMLKATKNSEGNASTAKVKLERRKSEEETVVLDSPPVRVSNKARKNSEGNASTDKLNLERSKSVEETVVVDSPPVRVSTRSSGKATKYSEGNASSAKLMSERSKSEEVIDVFDDSEGKVGHGPSVRVSTRSLGTLKATQNSDGNASTTARDKLKSSDSAEENKDPVSHIEDVSTPLVSVPETPEIPDSMFCNFDAAERSLENFQVGQIWAFYSNEDQLPKYYGQIKRVMTHPCVELKVTYLSNCWLPETAIRWEDKDMLISCGRFKVKPSTRPFKYSNTHAFSHQVQPTIGHNKEYEIFPRKGEIWALYRTWTTKMKLSDMKNWEYDIVEVVEESDSWTDVLLLEMVSGHKTVFKGKLSKGGSPMTMTISRTELLRFSHQIPAFKLTEEHGNGNMRGFWELDPGAIPNHYFSDIK